MKSHTALLIFLFSAFINVHAVLAQSIALPEADLKDVVISMRQEESRGLGRGIRFSYTLTLSGNGQVTFDGMDEGKAISKYEPPVKVTRRYRISKRQFKELVDEFYRIDFFSLKDEYRLRDNGDGTFTIINDGGLATVTLSIAVNGKTKTVRNINFAPEKLIELQRRIYTVGGVSQFVKFPPYWLSRFPNEEFPPRSLENPNSKIRESALPGVEYRKIQRNSPQGRKERHIDLEKRWGFITPCASTRTEVEKLLGNPIANDEDSNLPTYDLKNEKIRVFYSTERTDRSVCETRTPLNTVILFSVIPIRDLKLSELKIDPAKFKKDERNRGREFSYNNQAEGIFIETELVEFSDRKRAEMVSSIQFGRNFRNRRLPR